MPWIFTLIASLVFVSPVFAQGSCVGDLNKDSKIDSADVSLLLADFWKNSGPGDLNGDKLVDVSDYSLLIKKLNTNCAQLSGGLEIEAEDYLTGGEGVGYHDVDPENKGQAYRQDGVDIKDLGNGNYAVGWMANSEWLKYSINVPTAGNYTLNLNAGSLLGGTLKIYVNDNLKGSLAVTGTGGYNKFSQFNLSLGRLESGPATIKLEVEKQWMDIDSFKLVAGSGQEHTKPPIVRDEETQPRSDGTPNDRLQLPSNYTTINPPSNQGQMTTEPHNIMRSKGSGTTFYFKKGTYRISESLPVESNDTLLAEKGTIISGAKLLKFSDKVWDDSAKMFYFPNQTQQGRVRPGPGFRGQLANQAHSGSGYICQSSSPRCAYPEDLFVNNEVYKHMWINKSNGQVPAGSLKAKQMYFDYDRDRIYFVPHLSDSQMNNATIETSVTNKALVAWVDTHNVTVENFIFEKFATPSQESAVEVIGQGGKARYNEIRYNHGTGLGVGTNGLAEYNFVHHNGQKGLGGGPRDQKNATYRRNEVSYNNYAGYEVTWEAGGSKWAFTDDFKIIENYSHHNDGSGLWTDIDNVGTLYEGNKVIDNTKHGFQLELLSHAIVKNNYAANNGQNQIFVQNSGGHPVTNAPFLVENNIAVSGSGQGIVVQNDNRGYSQKYPLNTCTGNNREKKEYCVPVITKNITVQNNKIYHQNTKTALGFRGVNRDSNKAPDPLNWQSVANENIKFLNNTIFASNKDSNIFSWGQYGNEFRNFNSFKSSAGNWQSGTSLQDLGSLPTKDWNHYVGPR